MQTLSLRLVVTTGDLTYRATDSRKPRACTCILLITNNKCKHSWHQCNGSNAKHY